MNVVSGHPEIIITRYCMVLLGEDMSYCLVEHESNMTTPQLFRSY